MERIASFTINHLELFPGLYVSRRDRRGDCVITTFDMRITAPNREPDNIILSRRPTSLHPKQKIKTGFNTQK